MIKRLSIVISLFLVSGAYAGAGFEDNTGFYVKGIGMANWLSTDSLNGISSDYDVGYGVGAALGYRFDSGTRLEGEVVHRSNELDSLKEDGMVVDMPKVKAKSTAYMFNVIQDFGDEDAPIRPYVGAGAGYVDLAAELSVDGISAQVKNDGAAFQVFGGINTEIADLTELGIEYRYFVGREHASDHGAAVTITRFF